MTHRRPAGHRPDPIFERDRITSWLRGPAPARLPGQRAGLGNVPLHRNLCSKSYDQPSAFASATRNVETE